MSGMDEIKKAIETYESHPRKQDIGTYAGFLAQFFCKCKSIVEKYDAKLKHSDENFEEWYSCNAHDYASAPIGSRDCGLQRKAWNAALEFADKRSKHPPATSSALPE